MSKISLIDGEEVIYATIKCPDDGETDYAVITDLEKIAIKSDIVAIINILGEIDHDEIKNKLSIKVENNEATKVIFTSTLGALSISKDNIIEVDELVNMLANSIYQDVDINMMDSMVNIRAILKEEMTNRAFNDGHVLIKNTFNNNIAILYDDNKNAVGVSAGFYVTKDGEILLNRLITKIPISDLEVGKIELHASDKKMVLKHIEILSYEDGEIKSLTVKYKSSGLENGEIVEYKELDSFDEIYEEYAYLIEQEEEDKNYSDINFNFEY